MERPFYYNDRIEFRGEPLIGHAILGTDEHTNAE